MRAFVLSLFVILIGQTGLSQRQLYLGNDNFKQLRYNKAIDYYTEAMEKKPSYEAALKLADSYRFTNNYGRAERWYKKAVKFPEASAEAFYQYGQVLKINQKYEDAKLIFQRFLIKSRDTLRAEELMASCDFALDEMAKEHNYAVKERGDLNTRYNDFGVVFTNDSSIVFTSNRRKGEEKSSADQQAPYFKIFHTVLGDSGKAVKSISPLRFRKELDYHAATPSFTSSADTLFFTRSFVEKDSRESINRLEIYMSIRKDGSWSNPKKLNVNKKHSSAGHPYYDAKSKTLYFISDRAGGIGGYDMYASILENGKFLKAVNLGNTVNSKEDEFYPSVQNGILYFSSKGHKGLGALDIFKSDILADLKFSEPINLGAPFNSSLDDFAFVETNAEEDIGLFSSNREGRRGTDDIYEYRYVEEYPFKRYLAVIPVEFMDKDTVEVLDAATFIFSPDNPNDFTPFTSVNGANYFELFDNESYQIKIVSPENLTYEGDLDFEEFSVRDTILLSEVGELPRQKAVVYNFMPELISNKVGATYKLNKVYFDYNSAEIRTDAEFDLKTLAIILKNNPDVRMELGSHCDSRGNNLYNLRLSQKRADAVRQYLINQGIDGRRLESKGYGETQPTNRCKDGVKCSEEEYQANRRTEFKIIK